MISSSSEEVLHLLHAGKRREAAALLNDIELLDELNEHLNTLFLPCVDRALTEDEYLDRLETLAHAVC